MENLESIKELTKRFLVPIFLISVVLFSLTNRNIKLEAQKNTTDNRTCIWEICSVDTMRTSRDLAREMLNNSSYDALS